MQRLKRYRLFYSLLAATLLATALGTSGVQAAAGAAFVEAFGNSATATSTARDALRDLPVKAPLQSLRPGIVEALGGGAYEDGPSGFRLASRGGVTPLAPAGGEHLAAGAPAGPFVPLRYLICVYRL